MMRYWKLVLFGSCETKDLSLGEFKKLIIKANKSVFIRDRFEVVYCADSGLLKLEEK